MGDCFTKGERYGDDDKTTTALTSDDDIIAFGFHNVFIKFS
jgi:hypothetical protein